LLIVLQVAGGLALEIDGLRQIAGLSVNSLSVWHQAGAGLLFWVVVLHVLSVLLREVRTKSWDISAMIQGYRVFRVERQGETGRQGHASVSVAEIVNRREKG
jgi:Ni,Fe-hydrogenase I cytochrome b subunit